MYQIYECLAHCQISAFLGNRYQEFLQKLFAIHVNSYYKKDYSKGEVNAIEITQKRLQKMKKNAAMTTFYCLVSKIWKKILCFYKKRRKDGWFVWFH